MPHATIETFIPMVAEPQLPLKRAGQLLGAMSEGLSCVDADRTGVHSG